MTVAVGIDIGSTRVRLAVRGSGRTGTIDIVGARDLPSGASDEGEVVEPEIVATIIEDLLDEMGVRARSCVCAVGPPVATLRIVDLPRMGALERERAARLDVERRLGREASDVVVRARRLESGSCVVGAVSGKALRSRAETVRRAGLRASAVDFEGDALARAFPKADAVLDLGLRRVTLHALGAPIPTTLWSPVGGAAVTAAIGDELGIEERKAETRKRTIGAAGAGESAFRRLVDESATLIRSARRRGCAIERIALFGNASRMAGLRAELARAADVDAPFARPAGLSESSYPDDVAIGGSADWGLAIGLALWSADDRI